MLEKHDQQRQGSQDLLACFGRVLNSSSTKLPRPLRIRMAVARIVIVQRGLEGAWSHKLSVPPRLGLGLVFKWRLHRPPLDHSAP